MGRLRVEGMRWTGQAWEIQLIVAVEDVYVAESIFWGHSKYADIPFLGGVEIVPMTIGDVESAINALLRLSQGGRGQSFVPL